MRKHTHTFESFVNKGQTPENLEELIDYYIQANHPTGFVLVCIDSTGGLKIMIEPSEEEIEEMVENYDCELYENGERVHNWY